MSCLFSPRALDTFAAHSSLSQFKHPGWDDRRIVVREPMPRLPKCTRSSWTPLLMMERRSRS